MTTQSTKLNKYSWFKIGFAILYTSLGIFLICFFRKEIFNQEVDLKKWEIYYRLLWSFSFGLFGFSVLIGEIINNILYRNGKQDMSPFPSYLLYYLPIIIITSVLSFFIFSKSICTLGNLFYSGTAFVSFFLGFYVDNIREILKISIQ
jgi:hypothetical protein